MNDTLANDVISLAQTDWFVAFLHENLLDIFKLVAQLLLFDILGFNLGSESLILGVLFDDLFTTTCKTLLGLTN
jgi:hypothetical protein